MKEDIILKNEIAELFYREGQIWWTALGKNIGFEMDGKKEEFHRPVLILKKYNEHMCFVLPLTTQVKDQKVWYQVGVSGSDKKRAVNITQGRAISTRRLLRKDSVVEQEELQNVKDAFVKQFI